MSTGKRLAKRSIIGTRVCAPGDDGKFYSGVIHAVKTPGVTGVADETRYSVRFDACPGGKRVVSGREYRETELVGPGFRAVTGFELQRGQRVFLTYNGREVTGEVMVHAQDVDEVMVRIVPPGHERRMRIPSRSSKLGFPKPACSTLSRQRSAEKVRNYIIGRHRDWNILTRFSVASDRGAWRMNT
uniref:DUF4772 domain-containing protein n=1 Tax=Timema monikensis TaxID=170555 RepID=A0A7R9E5A6_9NEOP|nr:unnamed protein product [Timema monikensis]